MARRPSKLTEQQQTFVDNVLEGRTHNASAVLAGYPNATAPDKSENVRNEIARARAQLTDLTTLKRLDVIDGILDGVAIARMQADAGNVIKGWTEIAKILGHYAPEVKNINLNTNQQRVRSKLESLDDADLLAIANGVVDVEAREVPGKG